MVTIIQDGNIEYIMNDQIRSISHNKNGEEVRVKYLDGQEIRYFHVKELRF